MLQPVGLAETGHLAGARTVVEFRFSAAPPGKSAYWLVVDDGIDLCLVDPGHPVDLWVRADLRALTEVWMGDHTMRTAMDVGTITLDGPQRLVKRFPDWFGQHPVLGPVRPARRIE